MLVSWIFSQHTRGILKQNAFRCVNRFFKGVVPSNWRRFFDLKWDLADADSSITWQWLELWLDFQAQACTHVRLAPATEAGPEVNAERAANLFAPEASRVAQICGAATALGFGDKEARSTSTVSSLYSFFWFRYKAAGIPFRTCFLQQVSVHKLLTQAALHIHN